MICPKCNTNSFHPAPIDDTVTDPEPWLVTPYVAVYYCECSHCGCKKDVSLNIPREYSDV